MPLARFLILVFLFLIATTAHADSASFTRFLTDWNIKLGAKEYKNAIFNLVWPNTGKEEQAWYQSSFNIDDPQISLSLMIPPSWLSYRVYLNNILIIQEGKPGKFPGNIYETKISRIPINVMKKGENTLAIETIGLSTIAGFRGDHVTLTNNPGEISRVRTFNFLLNGVHSPLLMFSIFLLLFCMMLMGIERFRTYEYYLMLGYILCSLPYISLATDIYSFLEIDGIFPFRFQQIFQAYLWFCCAIFVLLKTNKRLSKTSQLLLQKRTILIVFSLPTCFFIISCIVNDAHFFIVSQIYFSFAILIFCTGAFLIRKGILLRYSYLLGVMIAFAAMYSDITRSNIYLFVYSFVTMNIVGVATMVKEIESESRLNHLGKQFMNQFLPKTAFDSIMMYIKRGKTYYQILEDFKGSKTLSIVLVDICDWGLLNHFSDSKIPEHFIRKARNLAFSKIENIMDSFDLELIKMSGDNMLFVGGLGQKEHLDSEIAKKALQAMLKVLESIDKINAKLREERLPYLELKLSASYGKTSYAIEKFSSRGSFDVQGHFVNTAYRIEHGIGKEAYSKFGKNLAVVEENIFNDCDDIDLISRFRDSFIIGDKHGIFYNCRVAKQYTESVDLKDFSEAMYSFFRSQDAKAAAPIHSEQKKKSFKREKVYLGENLIVTLKIKDLSLQGSIIDFSPDSIKVAVNLDTNTIHYGDIFNIQYQLWEQKFNNDGKIIDHYKKTMDNLSYDILEVQILPADRGSKTRRNCRFEIGSDEIKPTAQIRNPFTLKNTCNLEIRDISSDGFGTNCPPEFTLFPGVTVDAEISFPFSPSVKCKAVVRHISSHSETRENFIGFETISNYTQYQEISSAYLLKTKGELVTPNYLRSQGFNRIFLESAVTFKYRETDQDYIDIAKLRLKVWQSVGMFKDKLEKDYEDMLDLYDTRSRHILAYHGNRLVGSARVVFNNGDNSKIEHGMYHIEIPAWLKKRKFVEFSRAVIDEKYREGVLWFSMLFHLGRVLLESGHDIALISCTKKLYRKIYSIAGFKKICEFICDEEVYYLTYLDMRKVVDGKKMLPIAWSLGYKELHYHLKRQGKIHESLIGTFNISVQELADPVVQKLAG